METWKAIPGFNRYEACDSGFIRSLDYKRSGNIKIIKPAESHDGYLKTMLLGDDGKYHTSRVHRWVALTFLGLPDGLEVNHKDGNKKNNAISNLEYCTRSQNIKHAYDNGLEKPKRGIEVSGHKLNDEAIREIRQAAKNNGRFWGRKDFAKKYGVSEATLKDIVSQRRGAWKHIV